VKDRHRQAATLGGAGRSRLEPDAALLRGDTLRIVDFLQHSRGRSMIGNRPWSLANKWLESRNILTRYICLETQ
jgi:hypothetical protein